MNNNKATIMVTSLKIEAKYFVDDWYDMSVLGKGTNIKGPHRFDRLEGVLYGEEVEEPKEIDYYLDGGCIDYEAFDAAYDEWSKCGYEVPADNLGNHYSRGEYRYFVPAGHVPYNKDDWAHVEPDVIETITKKHGSVERACISYAIEDWYRAEDMGNGWSPMGLVITIYGSDGKELGSTSVSGIPSDCGDAYLLEDLKNLVVEVANNALDTVTSIAPKGTLYLLSHHEAVTERVATRILEALNND